MRDHMAPRIRRTSGLVGGMVVLLALSAVAWACTPNARQNIGRASGPAGTAVKVSGNGYPSGGVIEIRWNAMDGPVLASTQGPSFSVKVTIPNDPPGVYSLVSVGYAQDGSVAGKAASSFEITSAGSTGTTPRQSEPRTGSESSITTSGGAQGSQQSEGTGDSSVATSGGESQAAQEVETGGSPVVTRGEEAGTEQRTQIPVRKATRGAVRSEPRSAQQPASFPASVASGPDGSVRERNAPPPAQAGSGGLRTDARTRGVFPDPGQDDREARGNSPAEAVSEAGLSSDLFSGFAGEGQPSSLLQDRPADLPSPALGIGLLAAGGVLLLGGFVAAEAARRRRLAASAQSSLN